MAYDIRSAADVAKDEIAAARAEIERLKEREASTFESYRQVQSTVTQQAAVIAQAREALEQSLIAIADLEEDICDDGGFQPDEMMGQAVTAMQQALAAIAALEKPE